MKRIVFSLIFFGLFMSDYAQNTQNSEWKTYFAGLPVYGLCIEGDTVWAGVDTLVAKMYKNTDEVFYYDIPNPGLRSIAYQISVDQNRYKWISCSGPQPYLLNFDGKYWKEVNIPPSFGFRLAADSEGIIWFAFLDLYKYEGNEWENCYSSNSDSPNSIISAIFCDKKNNKWLALTTDNVTDPVHVVKFGNENLKTFTSSFNFSVNEFSSIVVNKDGIVWMGTGQNGLLKFDGNLWMNYNTFNSELPSNNIKKVAVEKDYILWVATEMGLTRFDGETWDTFNADNSILPSSKINSILIDEDGTKWIGTDLGLISFDESSLETSIKQEQKISYRFNLFPNPANEYFNLKLPSKLVGSAAQIINIQGTVLRNFIIDNVDPQINISDFPEGTYLLRMQYEDATKLRKFVKQ